MSWGFGAGYPQPPSTSQSFKKPSLAQGRDRGQQRSGRDPGEGSGDDDGPGREGGRDLGSLHQGKQIPPHTSLTQGPVNDKTNWFVGHLISKQVSWDP